MGRLEGKVALISGGARGQGATEARLFAQEGARVVVGDILDAAGTQVEEAIRAQGGEATYVHLDVTHEADWVEAVGTAVNRYGKLDILVNNAGIVLRKGIEDTTEADWDRIMAVNAKGCFWGRSMPFLPCGGLEADPFVLCQEGWPLRQQDWPFGLQETRIGQRK